MKHFTQDDGTTSDFITTCSARVEGRMGAVYPFSKLIADRALIRISFFWLFDFDTPRDQVRSIRAHYEVARSGVVIEPLYPATPRSFIWTHKPEPILKALAQRGYPVEWVDRIELLR